MTINLLKCIKRITLNSVKIALKMMSQYKILITILKMLMTNLMISNFKSEACVDRHATNSNRS